MSPSKPTLRERVSYLFDSLMSRGTLALIGGLIVLSLIIIVIAATIISLGGLSMAPEGSAQPYHVVTPVRDPESRAVLRMIGQKDLVQPVLTNDLIARVAAQSSRQPGLSVVYTELINFGGDEIYFADVPGALMGKTYGDLLLAYEDSSVMGVRRADIATRDETPFSIVSEMLDLRNRELAEVAGMDDFIISEHLVSLMMSQLAENADLFAVFNDIFDPQGSEIYLKPVTDYVHTGRRVNFYTVVEAARRRNQTPIGYRLVSQAKDMAKAYGVHTNPRKSEAVTFAAEDKIIVLAES